MNYNKTYESFMSYADKCKNIIKNTFFTYEDTEDLTLSKDNPQINEIVTKHRLKMIDVKIEHTMRMIEQVIKINENLGFNVDMKLAIKVATLYHDVGRLRQATWCNTFHDSNYIRASKPYKNHGEEGCEIFLSNDFNVDKKYIPIIGRVIYNHQNYHLNPKLNYRYNTSLSDIDIENIITGKQELNDAEWEVASLIVQLVADIDKTDILYQHLLDDFDMIRDYVEDRSEDTLENIASRWGISKKDIIDYNNIDESTYKPGKIKVPTKNMPINKLEVPDYMKTMFYNNTWPDLPILIYDKHWHFITILWWRLSHFLNEISFTSTIINIEESNLLKQIYEKIPAEYKPLVKEAFEYSDEFFIKQKIEKHKGKIYIKK